jgi:nucleoside 2-deoxyribosyltransferase
MRIYFAGPLFSAAERDWNAALVAVLRREGHEVYLPQENEPGKTAAQIFAVGIGGIDSADTLVAVMDGADPDSGTSWEVGYAYGIGKPVILVRTDTRRLVGMSGAGYNPMLTEAATIRIDLFATPLEKIAEAVLGALRDLQGRP